MNKKIRIAVIYGGRSGEHEVSVMSAKSIINALDKEKYEVLPIYINKKGQWFLNSNLEELTGNENTVSLLPDPKRKDLVFLTDSLIKESEDKIDVIFPILHGTYGEDGTIQGLLGLTDIPYVGAGVLGSAAGMDKAVMKALFAQAGLLMPSYLVFMKKEIEDSLAAVVKKIEETFGYNVFVKPANLGSSVGISKAHHKVELESALKLAALFDRKILVEDALENIREIEVSVLGNDNLVVSLPGEVIPSGEFYDYEAKYLSGKSELLIPAPLEEKQIEEIQEMALKAFRAVDCAGMGRVDFFLSKEDGKIYIDEINTLPGFTSISMYPKLWEVSGLPYQDLIDKLVQLAMERHQEKSSLKTSYD